MHCKTKHPRLLVYWSMVGLIYKSLVYYDPCHQFLFICFFPTSANDSDDTDKENSADQLSQVFVSRSSKALNRNIVDNNASESASTDKKVASLFELSTDSESDDFKITKIAKSPAKKNVKKPAAAGPKLVNYRTPSKTKQLRQTRIDVTRLVPPVASTKLHKLESFEGGILKSGDR